jgi:hypothetical protein
MAAMSALAVLLLIISEEAVTWQWIEKSKTYLFVLNTGYLMAVCLGLSLALLITAPNQGNTMRDTRLLPYVVVFCLILATNYIGIAFAQLDSDPTSSQLSIIEPTVATPGRVWRLVTTIDGSFVAVSLGTKREDNVFRLFAASEIAEITSPPAK